MAQRVASEDGSFYLYEVLATNCRYFQEYSNELKNGRRMEVGGVEAEIRVARSRRFSPLPRFYDRTVGLRLLRNYNYFETKAISIIVNAVNNLSSAKPSFEPFGHRRPFLSISALCVCAWLGLRNPSPLRTPHRMLFQLYIRTSVGSNGRAIRYSAAEYSLAFTSHIYDTANFRTGSPVQKGWDQMEGALTGRT